MALPAYVVRRAPGCGASIIELTINQLVADGYEFVAVMHHSQSPPPGGHDGRTCVVDVIGVKK
jgi:hypothetical protein